MKVKYIFLCISITGLVSCAPVKPWQRAYLNDPGMQPGKSLCEKFGESALSYREGASGGGSGKASGGCGCN